MTRRTTSRVCVLAASLASAVVAIALLRAQRPGTTYEEVVAPGANYNKAEFRLWCPDDVNRFQAVAVLTPGSNEDGRSQVDDVVWQAFARKHRLALIGVRLTDKPHDQAFIEDYVNVSKGSGQALLDALTALAKKAAHPEIAEAPLLLWGMSAGGQFNYEFVNWKPERVAAFVVNKGGIYYTALTSPAARRVPGLLFIGGKDLDSRIQTITGLFALNRRAGALWALAEEPGVAHRVGRSRDLALIFFEDIMGLRLPLTENAGLLGDLKTRTIRTPTDQDLPAYPLAWLPTMRIATAWQALLLERPFEP